MTWADLSLWITDRIGYEHRDPSSAGIAWLIAVLHGAHRVVNGHVCGWPRRGNRA